MKISGVRKVLHGSTLCTTWYSGIHDFDVYFSLRVDQHYCMDYETVVLDEINELVSDGARDIEILLDQKKTKVTLYIPQHRKLKARIVQSEYCPSVSVAENR